MDGSEEVVTSGATSMVDIKRGKAAAELWTEATWLHCGV